MITYLRIARILQGRYRWPYQLIGPAVATVKNADDGKVGANSATPNLWGETTLQSTTKSKG